MSVKKYGPLLVGVVGVAAAAWGLMAKDSKSSATAVNPLVAPWTGPYGGVPPWDQVRPDRFPDAFTIALAEERDEIAAIASNGEPATFQNTIEALERSSRARNRVTRLFSVATQN